NILVTRDGRVKVTDFGIARALSESALTLPGTTLGSVHYFSPEQARGELASPASDIYSLGIVLFERLTGRRPFQGDSAAAIATSPAMTAEPGGAGVTRPDPNAQIAYPRDAYAGGVPPSPPARSVLVDEDDDEGRGGSPWLWLSALLALAVLALAGFLVFRL